MDIPTLVAALNEQELRLRALEAAAPRALGRDAIEMTQEKTPIEDAREKMSLERAERKRISDLRAFDARIQRSMPINPQRREELKRFRAELAAPLITPQQKVVPPPVQQEVIDAVARAGAFFTMRTIEDDADPAGDTGDIVLQGGNVGGGTGNVSVDEILLFDQSADGGAGEWQGDPAEHLELSITGVGIEADGVLLAGFNVATAAAAVAASIGSNTLPVAGTLAGTLKISLGTFFLGGFTPSAAGDVNVTFCPGAFTPERV
jgi:hypothetical protein